MQYTDGARKFDSEVCFCAMEGSPLPYPKKTWDGQTERRALLANKSIELPNHIKTPGRAP
ncbi:MAG: DUF429 domain-containing protein [Thermoanaerobaculales bacterium]